MSFARSVMFPVILGISLTIPAAAQENGPTMGRSIETLAKVKMRSCDGAHILFGSRIKPGKPTLVSIWATWCTPCVAEAPYLDKIRKDLGGGYNFLYINRSDGNPDPEQPPGAIAEFLARADMSDVDYVTANVKAYRQIIAADLATLPEDTVGIPRVYLFDRNGRQIYTSLGFSASASRFLETRVKQAMSE